MKPAPGPPWEAFERAGLITDLQLAAREETMAGQCSWDPEEQAVLDELTDPFRIQAFLNGVPYSTDPVYRSPKSVLRDRKAHCFDGALFAAAALRRIGHAPVIVDLRAENDDDHVIALYRVSGRIGAVATSNFVHLRFREPIFRSPRELALSYFEFYYNLDREKTLRSFSVPLDLRRYDGLQWMIEDGELEKIVEALDRSRHYPLLPPEGVSRLSPVDERTFQSGMVGTDQEGLYRPRKTLSGD